MSDKRYTVTLKPCPFCGHSIPTGPDKLSDTGRPIWEIRCGAFCCSRRGKSKDEVASFWNTRATLTPEPSADVVETLGKIFAYDLSRVISYLEGRKKELISYVKTQDVQAKLDGRNIRVTGKLQKIASEGVLIDNLLSDLESLVTHTRPDVGAVEAVKDRLVDMWDFGSYYGSCSRDPDSIEYSHKDADRISRRESDVQEALAALKAGVK